MLPHSCTSKLSNLDFSTLKKGYVLPGLQSIDHQGPNFAVLAIKKGIPFERPGSGWPLIVNECNGDLSPVETIGGLDHFRLADKGGRVRWVQDWRPLRVRWREQPSCSPSKSPSAAPHVRPLGWHSFNSGEHSRALLGPEVTGG